RMAIDATTKIGPERRHDWGQALERDAATEARITERWGELGLEDLGRTPPDPVLFGYVMENLLARLGCS
ncbi:MAG: UbiD family decarboxylase, partial [Synechococcus sp. SB0672_bin_6]|nr:UbiD family decarboxylase [Synechococcus sp. SB0672_bin_6]